MKDIIIKTDTEIESMRKAGRFLAEAFNVLRSAVKPGLEAWELEKLFISFCQDNNLEPSCKGYAPVGLAPFPTGLCLGINDQSVHCYVREGEILNEGDLLKLDTIVGYENTYIDSAITLGVGEISESRKRLIDTTQLALDQAISKVKPGIKTGVISNTIEKIVGNAGYSVLTDYAGHGIGRMIHEGPDIPCYGKKNSGVKLKPGMTIAIEPLICEKNSRLKYNDGWETRTVDGGDFAQIEHTVLVTEIGHEVLTRL
ncbi:type I methionyl aminopeptidase [Patescibacteria group bacterium]